jgi:hypothetical protein
VDHHKRQMKHTKAEKEQGEPHLVPMSCVSWSASMLCDIRMFGSQIGRTGARVPAARMMSTQRSPPFAKFA